MGKHIKRNEAMQYTHRNSQVFAFVRIFGKKRMEENMGNRGKQTLGALPGFFFILGR